MYTPKGIAYWYNLMIAAKQSIASFMGLNPNYISGDNPYQDLLNDIYTGSQVGRWRLTIWLFAYVIGLFELIMVAFMAEIQTLTTQAIVGTRQWYANVALAFQYGYTLTFNDVTFGYGYTDTQSSAAIAARIITNVAVTDTNGVVTYKVATGTVGNIAPLSTPQLTAFKAYVNQVQPAGININFISANADTVKAVGLTVFYDGTLDEPTFQAAVQTAITNFLSTAQMPFNGYLYLNGYTDPTTNQKVLGFIDAIVAVPGCTGAAFGIATGDGLFAAPNGGGYTQVVERYLPESGYYTFDFGNSSITYTIQ